MLRGLKTWPLWGYFLLTSAVFGLVTEGAEALFGGATFSILHAAMRGAIFGVMMTAFEAFSRRRNSKRDNQDQTEL